MNTTTNRAADNIRILAASMVEKAKSGHPGGAMGGADYINVLYSEFLNFDPDDGEWVNRDRFFLDPGHMSPMLYATLSLIGKYSMEDLKNFRQWGSKTPGHPEYGHTAGVDASTGPLGHGFAMGVGFAVAEAMLAAKPYSNSFSPFGLRRIRRSIILPSCGRRRIHHHCPPAHPAAAAYA